MPVQLKWNVRSKVINGFEVMIIGKGDHCNHLSKYLKKILDERLKNQSSLVHFCSFDTFTNLNATDETYIDFIVILVDTEFMRHYHVNEFKKKLEKIDSRFFVNSRIIFVRLIKLNKIISKRGQFLDEISKEYDSLLLTGCLEEEEYLEKLAKECVQYFCYIFQDKDTINVFVNQMLIE